MNNKKLFKGALVLFASILMAVSCSNNSTDGGADGNGGNSDTGGSGTETPEVNVTIEILKAMITTDLKTSVTGVTTEKKVDVELKTSTGGEDSKFVHLDFTTSFNVVKSKPNVFNVSTPIVIKNAKGDGSTGKLTADGKFVTTAQVADALEKALKATDTVTSGKVKIKTVVVTLDTEEGDTNAKALVTFTDNKDVQATIAIPLNIDGNGSSGSFVSPANNFKIKKGNLA